MYQRSKLPLVLFLQIQRTDTDPTESQFHVLCLIWKTKYSRPLHNTTERDSGRYRPGVICELLVDNQLIYLRSLFFTSSFSFVMSLIRLQWSGQNPSTLVLKIFFLRVLTSSTSMFF